MGYFLFFHNRTRVRVHVHFVLSKIFDYHLSVISTPVLAITRFMVEVLT